MKRTLKNQLLLVNIATTGVAVLVSLVLLLSAELRSGKDALVRDMIIKADIIGNQCTAALAFSSPRDAEEILDGLRADEQIHYAAVFGRDGGLFAAYRRRGAAPDVPAAAPSSGHRFGPDHLLVTRPITLDREQVGAISLRVGLDRLRAAIVRSSLLSAAVLVLALLAAGAALSRLQRTVTAPVTGLVSLMEGVSRDKDYSRRAAETGPAELLSLSASFNEMLAAIQSRDRDLGRSLAELRDAYGKLQELDRQKSDFLSMVSHELRTPIASIKAFVEVLSLKQDVSVERRQRILGTISDESDRLVRLISDLLDLSRIESGVLQWRDQETDLDEVVRAVVAGLLPLAQTRGLSIDTRTAGTPLISVDRDRLTQVIMNLLSNAIKFTPAGGRITAAATRQESPAGISFSIADTGRGISPGDLHRIFEKYQRAAGDRQNVVEGTGLGLAISRSIIEHYGGRIWATSEVGKGSVFTFFLPARGSRSGAPG